MKTKSKNLSLLLALMMLFSCLSPLSAFAKDESGSADGNIISGETAEYEEDDFFISGTTFRGLTEAGKEKLKNNGGALKFPALYTGSGSKVSNIAANGFKTLNIKSVSFSDNIESIGNNAFYNNDLSELTLPNSIKTVEYGAFSKNKISSLKLSNNLNILYPSVFGDNQLKEVEIPESVGEIRINAFERNPGDPEHDNKVVLIVSDVDKINFFNDTKDTYFIKGKVSDEYTAKDFTYVEKSQYGRSYVEITGLSASGKEKRKSNHLLNIPSMIYGKEVKKIDKNAFSNININQAIAFKSVILPSELREIGEGAFIGNEINALEFGKKLELIGNNAFAYNKITKVLIPESVKEIGLRAFAENDIKSGDAKIDNTKEKIKIGFEAFDVEPTYLKTAPKYKIAIDAVEGVTLTTSPENEAKEGQSVTIKYNIKDTSKELLSLKAKKKYGEVKITDNKFIMPKEDVTVEIRLKDKYTMDKWCAEDFTYEQFELGDIDDDWYINEFTVSGLSEKGKEKFKSNKNLVLPEMDSKGKVPKWVNENAFKGQKMDSLLVPSNYTHIQEKAFQGCGLKRLLLKEGLLYINDRAFENNALTEVTFPSTFKYPSKGAFKNNNLSKVVLPESCKSIGPESFMNNKISSVEMGNKVVHIYEKAFAANLLKEVNIPKSIKPKTEGVDGIKADAFDDNPGKANPEKPTENKVILWTPNRDNPNKLVSRGNYVVDPKTSVVPSGKWTVEDFTYGTIEVKEEENGVETTSTLNAVTGFSEAGLAKVETEKDLELPKVNDQGKAIEAVKPGAFVGKLGKKRLNTLKIPEGYKVIGSMAFAFNGCGGDLVLPDTMEFVDMGAFFRNEFVSLTVPAAMEDISPVMMRGNKLKKVTFKGNINSIGRLAFAENKLEEITVPDTLANIGEQAFTTNVGVDAFEGKVVIRTVSGNNPKNLKNAENYIIDPQGQGTTPSINYNVWTTDDFKYDGTKVTGFSAQGAQKIKKNKNLVVPDKTPDGKNVDVIGIDAFRNLNLGYDIESVKLPDTVVEIEDYAFQFNDINSVKLPGDLKKLGMGVFMMSNVNEVKWNSKLEYIDQACFYMCEIGKLDLPASVNTIMNASFRKCALTRVTFPAGSKLKTIEALAFADNKLANIELPDGVETMGNQVFANNKFKEINVPASVKEIGFQAFLNNPGMDEYDNTVVIHTPGGNNPNKLKDDAGKTFVVDPENIASDADKALLKNALVQAEKVDVTKLTATFKGFFNQTVEEARKTFEDPKASKSSVEGRTSELLWAIKRTELSMLMLKKENMDKDAGTFDNEKWASVETAYKVAVNNLMVISITDEELNKIADDLDLAIKSLTNVSGLEGAEVYDGEYNIKKTHYIEPYTVKVRIWVKDGNIVYAKDNNTVCDDPAEDEEHNGGYFKRALVMLARYKGKSVESVKSSNISNDIGIDAVSGATVSSNALHKAIKNAISKVNNSQNPSGPTPGTTPVPTPGQTPLPDPSPKPAPTPKQDEPVKPSPEKKGNLVIKKNGIIWLSDKVIRDIKAGKYNYIKLTSKGVTLTVKADLIKKYIGDKKYNSYFKVVKYSTDKKDKRNKYKITFVLSGKKIKLNKSGFKVKLPSGKQKTAV